MAKKTENKKSFSSEIDGKEVKLAIIRPNVKISKEAQLEYNRSFSEAVQSGALLKAKLQNVLMDQGVWSIEKQEQHDNLITDINEKEQTLARGGIKLTDAKRIALEMRVKRWRLRELISERTEYESNTAEGQAENARFNYLVSSCTVYNDTGEDVYSGLDDYLEQSGELFSLEAARMFANMMYGLEDDYEDSLPENKFLKEYNFVNEDLRLVNDNGNLVDVEGKRIDENGRYVDADGGFVDREGNPVNKEGAYVFEELPFLDDAGKPIEENKVEAEEEAEIKEDKPKRKGRPRKKAPSPKE